MYNTFDHKRLPVHYSRPQRPSCVLQSNSEVFLYTKLDLWCLLQWNSGVFLYTTDDHRSLLHTTFYFKGLPVYYRGPPKSCTVEVWDLPVASCVLQWNSKVFLFTTVELRGFLIYYSPPRRSTYIIHSISDVSYRRSLSFSCILQSNSKIFLNATVHFKGLPVYYSGPQQTISEIFLYTTINLLGLHVLYSRSMSSFCMIY